MPALRLLGYEIKRVRVEPPENFICSVENIKIDFPEGYPSNWNCLVLGSYMNLATEANPAFTLNDFDLLLDLGAHCGVISTWALSQGLDVISVEALPENIGLLSSNMARTSSLNSKAKYAILEAAITADDTEESVEFLLGFSPSTGRLLDVKERQSYSGGVILVETVSMRTIVSHDLFKNKAKVIVKFDIEGGEYLFFDELLNFCLMSNILGIFGEFHPKHNCEKHIRFLEKLKDCDFDVVSKVTKSETVEFFAARV